MDRHFQNRKADSAFYFQSGQRRGHRAARLGLMRMTRARRGLMFYRIAAMIARAVGKPHGQRDALARQIDFEHLDLDHITGFHDFARILDEAVRQRGYMQDKKAQEFAWRRALLPWLEPVAVPRYWRIVDEMPVNSMNKRVYAQLEELFHENS